ncbi:WD repeat-containing protein 81-like [Tubulanus polymorphus]|uniref:WD repeat-containing protein 81-like n=1 Tax=Tubulanus polymorphus TaxID=672921 RepID=UPI003DA2286C
MKDVNFTMDTVKRVKNDLRIQQQHCRLSSSNRVIAVVHEDWIKWLRKSERIDHRSHPKSASLDSDHCQLYLAQSQATIPAPWKRVSIKVIQKRDIRIKNASPLMQWIDNDTSYCETMSTVALTSYCQSWRYSHIKYNHQLPNDDDFQIDTQPFNDAIRGVVSSFYGASFKPIGHDIAVDEYSEQQTVKPISFKSSIVPAISLLESTDTFYIVQPYLPFTLHDIVTFSPAILEKSNAKSLFLLYQILQIMKGCHSFGVSVGNLTLHDVLVDDKLWLYFPFPSLSAIIQEFPSEISSTSDEMQDDKQLNKPQSDLFTNSDIPECINSLPLNNLPAIIQMWVLKEISNFQYLMVLNYLSGRRMGDPNHHPVLPWVMNFTVPDGGYRDLSKSKYRLNKGDRQLDITYEHMALPSSPPSHTSPDSITQAPHHISDVLSDITYYGYKARRTPKSILCTFVRRKWVPHEYPQSMQRLYEWTPDECIPEFFTDPSIFKSIHEDLPDLELPYWALDAEDFIRKHMDVLESDYVSERLSDWIDLTFGFKLSGQSAVKAKNVCLQLIDQHTHMTNHGAVQLFNHPHPRKNCERRFNTPCAPNIPRSLSIIQSQIRWKSSSIVLDTNQHALQASSDLNENNRNGSDKQEGLPDKELIVLPQGYNPVALLEELEHTFDFTSRTMHQLPPKRPPKAIPAPALMKRIMTHDVQVFACLMIELHVAWKLRMLRPRALFIDRFEFLRRMSEEEWRDIPRPIRQAALILLQLDRAWKRGDVKIHSLPMMFDYEDYNMMIPSPGFLLDPLSQILPFPKNFNHIYELLCKLKELDQNIETEIQGISSFLFDKPQKIRAMQKNKVYEVGALLVPLLDEIKRENLEIVLPYVNELFECPDTIVATSWTLFEPVARAFGVVETSRNLLVPLMKLYDGENSTSKHLKLYYRMFLKQLIIRLGLQTFLAHFATLLIEAVAGYKDFVSEDDQSYTESREIDTASPDLFKSYVTSCPPTTKLSTASIERELQRQLIEAHSKDEELEKLDILEELNEKSMADKISPEVSGSEDNIVTEGVLLDDDVDNVDVLSVSSQDNISDDNDDDELSDSATDISENELGRSLGNLSVHSVSRLMDTSRERYVSGNSENQVGSFNGSFNDEDDDLEEEIYSPQISDTHQDDDNENNMKEDEVDNSNNDIEVCISEPVTPIVRSETEEFTARIMQSSNKFDYNICDMATESVLWLAHKLGPVLTAKFLSRNLLRMLTLCYLGEEQLDILHASNEDVLSVCEKQLAGDSNASRVLDSLSSIATIYGEQVILLQYFPHIIDLISVANKKLTLRTEAGLVACLVLLKHILPYLSDTTFMDKLQDTLFQDILLPIIKLASSCSISFPSGGHGRYIICLKYIDVLYMVSLRIGFEMTREHMTPIIQRFFSSFDRVYNPKINLNEESSPGAIPTNKDLKLKIPEVVDDSMFCEIKMDDTTQEYKIGTPVRVDQLSWRYSLSPPTNEDRVTDLDEESNEVQSTAEKIQEELKEAFTPELAHMAYIPFCRVAGGIHMEQSLHNDDLIRKLCANYDDALAKQQPWTSGTQTNLDIPLSPDDELTVSGSFGRNVSMEGNKIVLQESDEEYETDAKTRGKVFDFPTINPEKLKSPEMENNKQRHLKGNWLAYWEHELGLSEKGSTFNFKQIKLQTYVGHTNSVRSLYVMDNENSFISASKDKTVKLWSIRNQGDGSCRAAPQWTYRKHRKSVFAVTFLESKRLVVSCDSVVHIWDPFVCSTIKEFEGNREPPVTVLTPMPSPSTSLITATTDSTLRFLDVRLAKYAHEYKCTTGPAGLIRCVTVSPNCNWVAIGYSSGIISILDVRTGLLLGTWKGHEGEILQIKASTNNSFVSSSFDQTMNLWSTDDGKLTGSLKGHTEPVHCFSFYKSEIISATTANRVGVHTSLDHLASFSSTKLRSDTFRGVLTTMAVLPLNRLLLLGADNGSIRLLC